MTIPSPEGPNLRKRYLVEQKRACYMSLGHLRHQNLCHVVANANTRLSSVAGTTECAQTCNFSSVFACLVTSASLV